MADNGGPTLTHALVEGSPAIDAGTNPLGLTTDQRGLNREFDGDRDGTATVDIGAFELQPATTLRITLSDGTRANGVDDITFGTPLSLFRDEAIDSSLVRPNFADTFQFIDITNTSDEETVTISSIDINVPGVSISPQGNFFLNPGETERVNLTYQPFIAGEVFDLSNGLVINSNALNSILEVHLSGHSTLNSDINYDGAVDLIDVGVLNDNHGRQIGEANFDPTTDINGDGRISLGDLGTLNTEFGMVVLLQDRIVVDTLEDEDDGDFSEGDRSLREALIRIAEGGTITFAPSLNNGTTIDGVITLSLGELVIDKSLTIDGDDGTRDITVDANGRSRVFKIDDGNNAKSSVVSIDGLSITGGASLDPGGGIYSVESLNLASVAVFGNSASDGGGIFINSETTTGITGSIVTGNSASSNGGGIYGRSSTVKIMSSAVNGNSADGNGGGIYLSSGITEITDSTISENSADGSGGGIGKYYGITKIINSTISGNSADVSGGGINQAFSTSEITNSTISGNSAEVAGGGIRNTYQSIVNINNSTISGNTADIGGGTYTGGNINAAYDSNTTLSNSLISGNRATSLGDEVVVIGTNIVNANTNSLFGDNSQSNNTAFSGFTPGVNDINATSDGINVALIDLLDLNLANNGGSTFTHALVSGSPAIDAGINPLGLTTDQRGDGFPRSIGGEVDIGAFESEFLPSAIVVDTLVDENDGDFSEGDRSLREALTRIAEGGTITFAPNLSNADGVITLSLGELIIDKALTIHGDLDGDSSTRNITIDAGGNSRVFRIDDGDSINESSVTINGLRITGGLATGFRLENNGGGIYNREFLNLTHATVSGNAANGFGGGILNRSGGKLEITDSIISDNSASAGGGISSDGSPPYRGGNTENTKVTTTLTNSIVTGNTSSVGSGVFSRYGNTQIINSTIANNLAFRNGGGVYNNYGTVEIINSTISGNSTDNRGGGVFNDRFGTVEITQSTISDNSASDGGGFFNNFRSVTFSNSLIAGNTATNSGNEIFNATSTSGSSGIVNANANNLFGDSSQTDAEAFSNFAPGNNDINATSDSIGIALNDILEPILTNNSGSTPTHALVPGSPAVDAGSNPLDLTTDQRGFNREFDGDQDGTATADIGAFELQPVAIIRITLPDGTAADGVDDITFGTPLSSFRDNAIDRNLVRPNFADTFQFIDITNTNEEEAVTINSIDINAPGVSAIPQGDFLLNPGETERLNLTYQPVIAGEVFDLENGLVINSDAVNSAFEVHLSGRSTFNSDINYDGAVNLGDLGVFNINFGSQIGDANFDFSADINRDGRINLGDLGILNAEIGQSLPSI